MVNALLYEKCTIYKLQASQEVFENAPIGMDECMTPMRHELANIVENYCWHIDGNRKDGDWWRFYVHFIIYGREVHNALHSNRKKINKMRSIRRSRKGHVPNYHIQSNSFEMFW